MDVVGGVIVAADHKDDRAYQSQGRGVKRGRCVGGGDGGDDGRSSSAPATAAWADEPWGRRSCCVKKSGEDVDLPEDYELRNVLSSYRPTPAPSLQLPRQPVVVVPPARSWVDPLRFLLKKELTVTDVGDLGRIILPKRDAECQLPHLDSKEGKFLRMEDYNSNKNWTLRYKWWPNNKSRMYVLENTGEFVKYYGLKEKDELIVYKDGWDNLVIRGRKWSTSTLKTNSSFTSSMDMKRLTPTAKRSPKGRSNLSKTATPNLNLNTVTLTTTTTANTMLISASPTNSYGMNMESASNNIATMGALIGPSIVGPYVAEGSPIIDWEELPDPPAIEFSDSPAIEFPEEFGCI